MAVNRQARTRLTSALAAYMRGEIGNLELDEIAQGLDADDPTLNDIIFSIWFLYDDFKDHPIAVTEEGWRQLQRILAFLKTDLERRKSHKPRQWFHLKQVGAVICLGALGLTCWWFEGDFFSLAAGWLLIGGVWWAAIGLTAQAPPSEAEESWPFETTRQWQEHAHLVDSFSLPPYDPVRHCSGVRIRHPVVAGLMALPGTLLLVALWPLWSFLQLLPRRG